ncbi:Uncharacterised protein [Legionella pneumophila]|nr:Uncharacterised protein [Legionella pneumophila]
MWLYVAQGNIDWDCLALPDTTVTKSCRNSDRL